MILPMMMCLALAQPPAKDFVGPPAPTDEPADDAKAIRRRLEKNLRAAEEKLRAQDAGKPTQELQKSIVTDLDALLKLMLNPPPPADTGEPPPPELPKPPGDTSDTSNQQATSSSNGPSGDKPAEQSVPSSRSQAGGSRRERKGAHQPSPESVRNGEQNPTGNGAPPSRNNQPNDRGPKPGDTAGTPGGNPDSATGATMPNQESGRPEKMSDMSRDVWGHLPESLRQEVDHYYRERFMPKYRNLLRQYYTKLAEVDRKNEPKK